MQKTFIDPFAVLGCLLIFTLFASPAVPAEQESNDKPQAIQPAEVDLGRPVNFQQDIAPILEAKCVACHNSIITESKLVLEDAESLLKGGKRGPAVVAEQPEKSRLFLYASRSEKPVMPPPDNDAGADPLTPQELGLLRQWILEGAAAGKTAEPQTQVQWRRIPSGVNPIYSVALSPWGRFAAVGRANRIHLYNLVTGVEVAELVDPNLLTVQRDDQPMYPHGVAHRDFVHSLAISPDGSLLASGGYRVVKLWKRLRNVQNNQFSASGPVNTVALRADGKVAAVGTADGTIQLWSLEDGKPVATLKGHAGKVTALEFRPTPQRRLQLNKQMSDAQAALRDAARKLTAAQTAERNGPQNLQQLNAQQIEQQKQELTAARQAAEKVFSDAQSAAQDAARTRADFDERVAEGSKLLSASLDKSIRVWNLSEGKTVRTIETNAPVNDIALNNDATQVISAEADKSIRVWSLADEASAKQAGNKGKEKSEEGQGGKPLREITGHGQAVTSVDLIRPAGNQIVSGSADGTVRIWNLQDGQQVRSMNHGGPVTAVAARSDGQRVASTGENGVAKLWQTNDGKELAELKGDLYAQGRVADLSRDKTTLDQKVSLADASVKEQEKRLKDREEAAQKAQEAQQAAEKKVAEAQKAHNQAADNLAAAKKELEKKPDDDALKKKVKETQEAAGKAADALKEAQAELESAKRAYQLAEKVRKDVQQQLTQAKDELETAQARRKQVQADLAEAQNAEQQAVQPLRTVGFSPDGKTLLTAGEDHTIHLWDAETGRALESYSGHQAPVATLAVGIQGKLVSGADDKAVIVWEAHPGWELIGRLGPNPDEPLNLVPSPFVGRVLALDFSPNGRLLATGGGDPSRSGELMIWDVEKQSMVRTIEDAHSDTVAGIDFSSDGEYVLSGSTDKFAKIFEVSTGKHVRSFEGHTHHVLDVTWKADGGTIATASADNTIKVWNVETGEQRRTISNYSKQVTSIQFVGTTDHVISCGGDRTVRLHRTANGQNFRNFGGGTDYMYAAAATRDESVVVAGGEDGVFRVWNGSNGQSLMTFPPPEPPVNLNDLLAGLAGQEGN